MTKSVVSGVAGSARILRLAGHELAKAEDHGKRLDHTGKMRQVREASPITTSGLDLVALREAHVAGALVPRGKTAALHMLVQFPTQLLNEPNPEWMLKHARAFAETVFGKRSIFADRVDRDEAGLHVVDLFLAPRYFKKTKHVEQEAVSISKHMKDLAINQGLLDAYNEKYEKKVDTPNLWIVARQLR